MDKRTAKAAEEKIGALSGAPSPEAAHEAAKANFEKALAKTREQTGEDPLKAVQEEAAEPEKVEKPKAKPKATPTKPAEPDRYAVLERQVADLSKQLAAKAKPEKEEKRPDFRAQATAHFVEKFGEEEGEALMAVVNPLIDRQEQIEKALQSALERGMKAQAKSARSSLGEKYERLKESDEAWEMIRAQGDTLIAKDAERFSSPEEAYAHVAESLYGAPEESEEEDEDDDHADEVEVAQVTVPSRVRGEKKLSPQQRGIAGLNHLLKHPDDVIGASRITRSSTL